MATGSTNREVRGLGEGTMQFIAPFQLMDSDGTTELFGVDSSGNVTAAGTFALAGTSNLTITNTAPKLTFVDSTASAKDLTIAVDGDKAQLREDAGAAGSLLVLDLANNRVGVATASPTVALEVTGAATISGAVIASSTLAVTGDVAIGSNKFNVTAASGNTQIDGTLTVDGATTQTGALTLSAGLVRTGLVHTYNTNAKVGATAGFVVDAATNVWRLATCPASQTGSTLVIPLTGLHVGDTVTAFNLLGQVESGGGTVTIDASLRKTTAAAGDITDGEIAAMTQLSVTADTKVSVTNTNKGSLASVVGVDEAYYMLITATTGASCDIDFMGVQLTTTTA